MSQVVKEPEVRVERLLFETWSSLREKHLKKVDVCLAKLRLGQREGRHPVYDFLSTYYSFPMNSLRRWSPGIGFALEGPALDLYAGFGDRKNFQISPDPKKALQSLATVDPQTLPQRRQEGLERTLAILESSASRAPNFGCFGLHEWAMVYRTEKPRHESEPLRLASEQIAEIVEKGPLRCTHWDAFRFFTPAARPLNQLEPSPETRAELEQPGCLHANMDLYRHAYKFDPWVGSDLTFEAFELAAEIRELDMRASPYDLRHYGFEPVPIETAEGRRVYEMAQRNFAARAIPIRTRLIAKLRSLKKYAENLYAENL